MKDHEEGHAVLLALMVFLTCSGLILSCLHTAFISRHIAYMDQSSLQAWQAADAGLAWAHCQLAQRPFNGGASLQAGLSFPNGACCTVSSSSVMDGTHCEHTVVSVGSYRGASYKAVRKFTILPP